MTKTLTENEDFQKGFAAGVELLRDLEAEVRELFLYWEDYPEHRPLRADNITNLLMDIDKARKVKVDIPVEDRCLEIQPVGPNNYRLRFSRDGMLYLLTMMARAQSGETIREYVVERPMEHPYILSVRKV